jgi:hypothetical protein
MLKNGSERGTKISEMIERTNKETFEASCKKYIRIPAHLMLRACPLFRGIYQLVPKSIPLFVCLFV